MNIVVKMTERKFCLYAYLQTKFKSIQKYRSTNINQSRFIYIRAT